MTIEQLIKCAREEADDQRILASSYTHLENYRVKVKHDEHTSRADNLDQLADWLEELKKLRKDARPSGEWEQAIPGFNDFYKCNMCKGLNPVKSKFCPHCGANMRGGNT